MVSQDREQEMFMLLLKTGLTEVPESCEQGMRGFLLKGSLLRCVTRVQKPVDTL